MSGHISERGSLLKFSGREAVQSHFGNVKVEEQQGAASCFLQTVKTPRGSGTELKSHLLPPGAKGTAGESNDLAPKTKNYQTHLCTRTRLGALS